VVEEFISSAMDAWAAKHGVKLDFIQPGKPTQNAHVESFNGRFRDECLAQARFPTLARARVEIELWRVDSTPSVPQQDAQDLRRSGSARRTRTSRGQRIT
jgi:putative transposase